MNITVQKYGGTSVGSPEKIKRIAKRLVELKKNGTENIVVVVSAMGKTTDELVALAKTISKNPTAREYDALISTGENVSAALLSMAIQELGSDAISLNGAQAGIYTEAIYSKAKILNVNPARIIDELKEGRIVIVTGFQGINDSRDVTTIGRGGSDTSAVVLAAYLNAGECEIYTDVDGVYTSDPRVVKKASKLNEISYEEMLELASLGAKVLHPRAVECAKENNIVLHVRSSLELIEGTKVKEAGTMEVNRPVTGITANEDEAKLSVLRIPDKPGVAGDLFSRLGDVNINVDMIIQSFGEGNSNNIAFTVMKDDLVEAEKIIKQFSKDVGGAGIETDKDITKISIVGVGMISKPGVAAKMFRVLGENHINIQLISTSEIKVSCVIDQKDTQKALDLLHTAFSLDKPST